MPWPSRVTDCVLKVGSALERDTGAILFVSGLVFVFCVFSLCCCLVVSTSALDCLERLVSEMTCCVSSGTLNRTQSIRLPCKPVDACLWVLTSIPVVSAITHQLRPGTRPKVDDSVSFIAALRVGIGCWLIWQSCIIGVLVSREWYLKSSSFPAANNEQLNDYKMRHHFY